jgi:TonB family protein
LRKRHLKHRVISILQEARMSKTRLISTLTTGLAVLVVACWLVTGAFPLIAEPQVVNDAAGVTVFLNGSQVLHRTPVHYPTSALQRGVQGSVSVEVTLDSTGNVSDAHVLSGPDELRSAVLQSVLDWHFTRDAANSTRDVQIAFELPQGRVLQGVEGGVTGGVEGGVSGGVNGGVVTAYRNGAPVYQSSPSQDPSKGWYHITSIRVLGLTDQARDALLASLPVHEGGAFTLDQVNQVSSAVRAFDEHLTVSRSGWDGETTLFISPAPPQAFRGMQDELPPPPGAGRQPFSSITVNSGPPPPPPPISADAQGNPPLRIKVGGNIQSAMIVSKPAPIYPQLAKSARVSGVVHLAVLIAKDGTVQELHALGGPALLIQAAMDAVRLWTYQPTYLNGEPVAVESTIDVNFTLNQ